MFCKYCGSKMPENAKFCQNCGGQTESNSNPQVNVPVNNPVVNNQPVNNMPINNVPMTTNGPKNNNMLLIILVIVGICAIAVPIILTVMNDSDKVEDSKKEDTTIKNEDKDEEPETEIEYPTTNTTSVQYSGYTFAIPNEYTYMEYEGNLAVLPSDSSWIVMFVFSDGEFDDLKTQLPVLDATLAEQYENASSEYKTYQGEEYILTDFVSDGSTMQMILTDAGNGKILMSLLMPIDASVTFDDLFYIAFPIVTSVK